MIPEQRMGDLFPDGKQDLCCRSLAKIRQPAAVAAEVAELEAGIYRLVREAKQFVRSARQMGLVRRVAYRSTPVSHAVLPAYPGKDFHVPNICWAEYIGKQRKDITDWGTIAVQLDAANASYDERLLHMRVHLAMRQYHDEGKRMLEQLKSDYALLGELEFMSVSQNIPVPVVVGM
ncbi:hypothetical protein A7Q00_05860 [Eikenella halliae]|uniref:Uncharacterized protein n=2 Tax=Eikenella halliae TaxID=1795832 RepID=A0A1B6VZ39_9NEIS|nr:hypothetical protein A7Q00_05860 [Eikenella halliae]